ncbi:MAG: preprotein translocase subunit SecG [Ruminococcus sp.]|jgi:preprotein translocase subunit SecG|nr:preprotein translocase subunit SecG [Ruminococcus sp.]
MELYEMICGAVVLLLSLLIIILCLMQDSKTQQNMTSALGGGSNESFYGQNEGRTREAVLQKITRNFGIIVFIVILLMNIVIPYIMTFLETTAE